MCAHSGSHSSHRSTRIRYVRRSGHVSLHMGGLCASHNAHILSPTTNAAYVMHHSPPPKNAREKKTRMRIATGVGCVRAPVYLTRSLHSSVKSSSNNPHGFSVPCVRVHLRMFHWPHTPHRRADGRRCRPVCCRCHKYQFGEGKNPTAGSWPCFVGAQTSFMHGPVRKFPDTCLHPPANGSATEHRLPGTHRSPYIASSLSTISYRCIINIRPDQSSIINHSVRY